MSTKRIHQLLAYQPREAARQGCARGPGRLALVCLDRVTSGPISAGVTSPVCFFGSNQEVIP
jgi:hypothetical protein